MSKGIFKEIHPILPVRDVASSIRYYVDKLGFKIAFADDAKAPFYAGIRRDGIEIHLQWHSKENWEGMTASSLRFVIEKLQMLFEEYAAKEVFHEHTALRKTSWGTEEFAFYDPDMNGLTFYRDLKK